MHREYEHLRLLEISALQEQSRLSQRCLGLERRIRKTQHKVGVNSTMVRQLKRIQHTLRKLWAERRARVADHRTVARQAVAAAAAGALRARARLPITRPFANEEEERRKGLCPPHISYHV